MAENLPWWLLAIASLPGFDSQQLPQFISSAKKLNKLTWQAKSASTNGGKRVVKFTLHQFIMSCAFAIATAFALSLTSLQMTSVC